MFFSFQRTMGAVFFLVATMMIFGCSGGGNPVLPSTGGNNDNQAIYDGGTNLGAFTLTLDPDNLTATIEPVDREAAMNVSRYVDITILGLHWDPLARLWDIDVEVENNTQYNGFGPWIVFTETGEQVILNQDGFIWIGNDPGNPPKRVPVIAFAKDNPQRIFPAHSVEFFHLQIHWPDGWEGFQPMEFFVDASYPGPRQRAIIEQLQIEPMVIPEMFNLTGFIKDWQNSSGVPPMDVWVDLTPIGGPPHEQLFDDGNHGDGAPHDDIWGCNFMGIMTPEPTPLTVYAHDFEGYQFENDVIFGFNEPPPCLPMEVLDEGQNGFMEPLEMIIRNQVQWEDVWFELHPDPGQPPPPPVDFSREQVVVVMLGARPSTGYFVHVDCVKEIGGPDGGPHTIVDYTEEIPGPDCEVLWVITFPFQLVKTPLTVANDHFFRNEHVYSCGGECVPQRDLIRGFHSNIHESRWEAIRNELELHNFWVAHGGSGAPPEINFPEEMAIIGMIGDRPTTGWNVEINCVEFINDDTTDPVVLIHATEIEPGPNCIVQPIETQPFHFIAVPMFEGRIDLILNHEIDPCEPPPCVDIRPLAEGDHSDIHWFVEAMFKEPYQWEDFWAQHGENRPAPEVDWSNEYVIALLPDDKPTTGFWIRVDCVRLLEDPSYGRITQVEYTLMIPGETCIVEPVVTQPFFYFAVPQLFNSRPEFIMHEEVYECEPPPDCQEIRPLAEGPHSNIHHPVENRFLSPLSWANFWQVHSPNTLPPEVFWPEEQAFALMLGDRPTSGFWIRLDCVRYFMDDPGAPERIEVEYTEMIPGPDCMVLQVITQPFLFFASPRFGDNSATPVDYIKHEEVYSCEPPDCQPQETIEQGIWSNIDVPHEQIIYNPDEWHDFWMWHNPDPSILPPPINFDENMVVVVCLGSRNTGGFSVIINCVQFIDIGSFPNIIVDYVELIPGESCIVPQVFTYPYHFVAVPRFEGVPEFNHHEVVYECP